MTGLRALISNKLVTNNSQNRFSSVKYFIIQ